MFYHNSIDGTGPSLCGDQPRPLAGGLLSLHHSFRPGVSGNRVKGHMLPVCGVRPVPWSQTTADLHHKGIFVAPVKTEQLNTLPAGWSRGGCDALQEPWLLYSSCTFPIDSHWQVDHDFKFAS